MKELKLVFLRCIQDSQTYGSNNEHMISRLFFTINGKPFECNIRQPYGENFSFESSPIEVDTPEELKRKINYGEFRDAAESYFRSLVGSSGNIINISNSTNIRMTNNIFDSKMIFTIHEAGPESGW